MKECHRPPPSSVLFLPRRDSKSHVPSLPPPLSLSLGYGEEKKILQSADERVAIRKRFLRPLPSIFLAQRGRATTERLQLDGPAGPYFFFLFFKTHSSPSSSQGREGERAITPNLLLPSQEERKIEKSAPQRRKEGREEGGEGPVGLPREFIWV